MSPSKLLLPLAFSSILTSSVTLISTSTNIVVSGLMQRYQMKPMGMFELAPVGIPIAIVGLIYMVFASQRWLPDRSVAEDESMFGLRPYMTEVLILPDSSLVGKTLAESKLGNELDLTVVRIVRGSSRYLAPRGDMRIQAEDVILVEGPTKEILKIKDTAGIEIRPDVELADPTVPETELGLVEVILLPKSPLIGRTLKGIGFRERYGLQVLGLNRHGEIVREQMSQVPLHLGDILLVQGSRSNIAALSEDNTFRIIGALDEKRPHIKRAPYALAIFVIAVWVTKYISLGSMLASLMLPAIAYALGSPMPAVGAACAAAAMIVFRHRSNVARLRTGTERRLGVRA